MSRARFVGRGLLWGLFASIALNVLLGAWMAASAVRQHLRPGVQPAGSRIERLAETLPAADAALLRAAFDRDTATITAARNRYHEADAAMRATLLASTYDPAAFASATADMRERRQALQLLLQTAVGRAAAQMSPSGRAKLAEWPARQ